MTAPRVELRWWEGCPSWNAALEMLREEMAAAGHDPRSIVVTEVTSDEHAERLGFPGSPTILVNGTDVQDPGHDPIGLSCRVYRRRDGRVTALPDPVDVHAAIARAAGASS